MARVKEMRDFADLSAAEAADPTEASDLTETSDLTEASNLTAASPQVDTACEPANRWVTPRAARARAAGPAGGSGTALDAEAAPDVAGYRVTGPLGEGGMGVVWRAVQLSTRREVALKLLGGNRFGSPRARAMFQREVAITARLEHPHIARVYDSGVDRGACFYTMELIDGVPLDKFIEGRRLPRRGVLELMRLVCLAMQHAHQKGVIHRDLKPNNILVKADGQPRVLDFGIAKGPEEQEAGLSMEGVPMGTPAFMSPEQAAGRNHDLDTRTDVYSLGVILFRLLTGHYPHDVCGPHLEVLSRIATTDPRRPRSVDRSVDLELEAILLKALEREPERRYASAGDLARDLGQYLAGEPVSARAPTLPYLLRKWAAKRRLPLGAAAVVLVALLAAAATAYTRVRIERDKVVIAQKETKTALGVATLQKTQAQTTLGFLQRMLASADRRKGNPADLTVRQALDAASAEMEGGAFGDTPDVREQVLETIAQTYSGLGLFKEGAARYDAALALYSESHPGPDVRTADLKMRLAHALAHLDGDEAGVRALKLLNEALKTRAELLGNDKKLDSLQADQLRAFRGSLSVDSADEAMIRNLTRSLFDSGFHDIALEDVEVALAVVRQRWVSGDAAGASAAIRRQVETYARDPRVCQFAPQALEALAKYRSDRGDLATAEPLYREAAALCRDWRGPGDQDLPFLLNGLGMFLLDRRHDYAGAETALREAESSAIAAAGRDHPDVLRISMNLAEALRQQGEALKKPDKTEQAAELYGRILGDCRRIGDADLTLRAEYRRAAALTDLRRYDLAEPLLLAASGDLKGEGTGARADGKAPQKGAPAAEAVTEADVLRLLVRVYEEGGRPADADAYRRKLPTSAPGAPAGPTPTTAPAASGGAQ